MNKKMVYISIIIPVRNEEKYIKETLEMLCKQTYSKDRFEILIIDGMSTDNTCGIVRDFIKENNEYHIDLLSNHNILSSSARNIGIKAAQGEYIAIIDGHVFIPNPDLLKCMEQIIETKKPLCLARPAPLNIPDIKNEVALWIALARKSWFGHSRKSYIYSNFEGFIDPTSSGFAYSKEVFNKVGYFDETFDAAEDVEFHHRLKAKGIKAYTSPSLLIYSYPRDSYLALYRQQTRYGEGRAKFIRKHKSGCSIETLIPPGIFIFFLSLPIAIALLSITGFLFYIYITIFGVYWLLLLVAGFREAVLAEKIQGFVHIATAIWITHMALGYGFLKRIFLPSQVLFKKQTKII